MTPEGEESDGSFRRRIYRVGFGFFFFPKRRRQYSRRQIPFNLDTKVLSSAGDRLFLGRGPEARRPSGK